MSRIKRDYNQNIFSELFYYDETSPSGLRYINNSKARGINKRYANDVVGSIRINKTNNSSVWVVKIHQKAYVIHRVIWKIIYGHVDEDKVIDHIDGNPLNNTIKNLRLTSDIVNNRNTAKQSNNTSGVTGVYFDKRGRWRVMWTDSNTAKKMTKSFSIYKYGDEAFELACKERKLQISKQKDYSERHGL